MIKLNRKKYAFFIVIFYFTMLLFSHICWAKGKYSEKNIPLKLESENSDNKNSQINFSPVGMIFRLIGGITVILVIIIGVGLMMKRTLKFEKGSSIKVLGRAYLDTKNYIAIVEINNTIYILGVNSNNITLLEKIDNPTIPPKDFQQLLNEVEKNDGDKGK